MRYLKSYWKKKKRKKKKIPTSSPPIFFWVKSLLVFASCFVFLFYFLIFIFHLKRQEEAIKVDTLLKIEGA
jgi:hypothetical protein